MFDKGSRTAPTPDPAIGQAALKSAEIGEQWLNFSKEAFAVGQERQVELDALTKQVTDMQLGLAQKQSDIADADRARYEETFRPIEDEFVAEAAEYGSPEKQEAAAAEARADVQAAAAAARGTAEREASSLGLNPASGRFSGIQRAGEMGGALASAGAANTARTATRDKGLALKADVVNLGKGLPISATAATQTAAGLGGNAVGLAQGTNGQALAAPGIMTSGYQGAMAGYGSQAGILNNLHNTNVGIWQTQQDIAAKNAGGFGSFLGGVAGLGAKLLTSPIAGTLLSDENLKEDKVPIEEGAALEAVEQMPVEQWRYKEGVADGGEHVGPYAQDFAAATGSGDGQSIPIQDAIGITMKAVQDVSAKVDRVAAAVGLGDAAARPKKKPVPANDNSIGRSGEMVGLGPIPEAAMRPKAMGAR